MKCYETKISAFLSGGRETETQSAHIKGHLRWDSSQTLESADTFPSCSASLLNLALRGQNKVTSGFWWSQPLCNFQDEQIIAALGPSATAPEFWPLGILPSVSLFSACGTFSAWRDTNFCFFAFSDPDSWHVTRVSIWQDFFKPLSSVSGTVIETSTGEGDARTWLFLSKGKV